MCELFGVTSNKKVQLNDYLKEFISHSDEHPNGWGMAFFDNAKYSILREPVKASNSDYLKELLENPISSAEMFAHIRLATKGHVECENTHPFVMKDKSGRTWTLAHNGTIFDAPALSKYQMVQVGSTDSERILYYIIDRVNEQLELVHFYPEERIELIESIAEKLSEHNKLNFILHDGEYAYVHINEAGTLHRLEEEGTVILSTQVLDDKAWEEVEQNTLFVYKDGELIHKGKKHSYGHVTTQEEMDMLFMNYSEL
ncbi:MAG: class II glutamine amidotransferase [Eubacterium sp.]|nr:class II glutamine amidotransferase [Eubacterium sp.]